MGLRNVYISEDGTLKINMTDELHEGPMIMLMDMGSSRGQPETNMQKGSQLELPGTKGGDEEIVSTLNRRSEINLPVPGT
jgi:hypothetical protein